MKFVRPHDTGRLRKRAAAFLLSACLAFVAVFPAEASYRPPDMEKKIFDTKAVKMNRFDKAGLVGALVSVARDFNKKDHEVEFDTRSYALAIAGRLDKDNSKVKDTLEQLKANGKSVGEQAERKRIAGRLYSGIRALVRKKDNKANQKCAAYCISVALLFDPEGEKSDKLKEMQKDLEKAGFKAVWKGLLKAPITHQRNPWEQQEQKFEEVEREMPGGKASKFATKQTRINGLVVRKLSSGRHMGAASSIMFTALREEGQDGLLFKFDQKVGTMMAGSIEEVIKLMRVRYEDSDKVPSGYKVDIVFEDKYTLVDGPSAGTAFALAVDALFSGNQLDDKYACTGAITADGQTGIIGGVASKIRGAKNKGCTLVGIPVANALGVQDYMLLHGIDQVLGIQVFTQKTFDQAKEIASKEKPEHIKFAIDEFNKIAEVVKKEGKSILKNAKVKAKLEAILAKVPHHLSAKILLDHANGKTPKHLSARGSLDEIDTECTGMFRAASMLRFRGAGKSGVSSEDAAESLENILKIKDIIDPRFKAYYQQAIKLCEAFKEGRGESSDKEFAQKIGGIMEKVQKTRQKILGDPKIMEEIQG